MRLSRRILKTLDDYRDKILLSDRFVALSGGDILKYIENLKPILSEFSRMRSRIGVLIPNSAWAGLAILAAIASMRVPVIINPAISRKHVEKLLPKMKLDFLIVSHFAFPELKPSCSFLHLHLNGTMTLHGDSILSEPSDPPHEDAALILYTSGSEGEPKGVQLSHTGINYTVDALIDYFNLEASSASTCILPLCHTMGLNTQFLPTFFAGGHSHFYEPALNMGKIYRRIAESKSTFIGLVTEFLQLCHEEKNRRALPPAREVKNVQLAGGVICKNHLHMAMELFPEAQIHKGYGLTEGIRVSMISSKDPRFLEDTAGHPLPGQEVEIRDESGVALPPNTIGEIHVRGPNVMLGYDNVNNDPIKNGFLNTVDLGYLTPDGYLSIHGRKDSIFKVNGECVSGREIENTAHSIYPKFRNVKCLPIKISGDIRPVLFVELKPNRIAGFLENQKDRFYSELKDRLESSIKMPGDIVIMDSFPRTYSGKLRAEALRECHISFRGGDLRRFRRGPNWILVSSARKGMS